MRIHQKIIKVRPPDSLDKVIARHKLPVVRCSGFEENKTGSCWYDSVACWINKARAEGTLDQHLQLQFQTRVTHPEVRAAVCDYLLGDECIMKETWIKERFGNDEKR